MQILRINKENFPVWRAQIEELFNSSARINFPDYNIDNCYGKDRCDKVLNFLKDGTAIVFVANEDDKLKGWIWCHQIFRMNRKRLHVAEIAVADNCRRQGVGSKLLNKIEEYAKENGYHEIELFATVSNINAINFYEKASFKPERVLMKKEIK